MLALVYMQYMCPASSLHELYFEECGDGRAVSASSGLRTPEAELDLEPRKVHQDLKQVNEEILSYHNLFVGVGCGGD